MADIKLYSYWRSSAAYRVRIALNLKQLEYDIIPVSLVRDGGEHHKDDYAALNPQQLVPTMVDGGRVIRQSMAMIEYLDDVYPEFPLIPSDPRSSAWVRSISLAVACDIHPLNNLRVLKFLKQQMSLDQASVDQWYEHWISEGLKSMELMIAENPSVGDFCAGDLPTMADCLLVPQLYNARRFDIDLTAYPHLTAIDDHCMSLEPFRNAAPEQQPDAG